MQSAGEKEQKDPYRKLIGGFLRDRAPARPGIFPDLGLGLGLRPEHYPAILSHRTHVSWFEAVSENYMGIEGGTGAYPLEVLKKIRKDYEIVLHGVSLNIGSTDPLNLDYLKKLKLLMQEIDPAFISDHLCWTGVNGRNTHDLLPLPFNGEAIKHLVTRILEVQDILGRRMVFENISSYLSFPQSEMCEWEFVSEIANRADCGLLLDINNIYVNSVNQGFDPLHFIEGIPIQRVTQFHLAGHSTQGDFLIDTHDQPVCEEVWNLYDQAVRRFGCRSTMVEWDSQIPEFEVLESEILKAAAIQRKQMKTIP